MGMASRHARTTNSMLLEQARRRAAPRDGGGQTSKWQTQPSRKSQLCLCGAAPEVVRRNDTAFRRRKWERSHTNNEETVKPGVRGAGAGAGAGRSVPVGAAGRCRSVRGVGQWAVCALCTVAGRSASAAPRSAARRGPSEMVLLRRAGGATGTPRHTPPPPGAGGLRAGAHAPWFEGL